MPQTEDIKANESLLARLNDIFLKEKEMVKREQKIQEIEERIEERLEKVKGGSIRDSNFFSKEFVQGLVTGFLITLILGLAYIKFYY